MLFLWSWSQKGFLLFKCISIAHRNFQNFLWKKFACITTALCILYYQKFWWRNYGKYFFSFFEYVLWTKHKFKFRWLWELTFSWKFLISLFHHLDFKNHISLSKLQMQVEEVWFGQTLIYLCFFPMFISKYLKVNLSW